MGQESIFSEAGRRNMVKAPSEAVRPSLNVTIQEKTNKNSLSHYGEAAMEVEGQNKREEQSSSSTDKKS